MSVSREAGVKPGTVVLQPGDEQRVVERALRALVMSHGGVCRCQACLVARPLMARIVDQLTTPIPRPSVDQGQTC